MKKTVRSILCVLIICVIASFVSFVNVFADSERSIELKKTTFGLNEAIDVIFSGCEPADLIGVYQKDKVPGVNGGIYYGCFDNTVTGREKYTEFENGVTSNLLTWYCATPENGDVKPFINPDTMTLKEGFYKIVVRNDGKVVAEKEFTVTAKIERSLSVNKEIYKENEPIIVTAVGADTDYIAVYTKNSIVGQDAGIFYACFKAADNMSNYTVVKSGVASNLREWYCATPDNPQVKPYINVPEGEYKVVIRNKDGNVVVEQAFAVEAEEIIPSATPNVTPNVTPTNTPSDQDKEPNQETGDNNFVVAVFLVIILAAISAYLIKKMRASRV